MRWCSNATLYAQGLEEQVEFHVLKQHATYLLIKLGRRLHMSNTHNTHVMWVGSMVLLEY